MSKVKTEVLVKDVMTSPVIKVFEDETIRRVAKLMDDHNLGSIIVTDGKGNPTGIITERDIVKRVTAKNLIPNAVKAKEVMSSPLVAISPDEDISEAAKTMSKSGIRRLIVIDGKKMIGIISSNDIVSITPALIELMSEKARITQGPAIPRGFISAGYCDRCRQWSESLLEVDSGFLCEERRIEMHED
ncbi:MAG: CBS domain-containing protein [Candidatus Bathyarchaeota archaeon]|nr:MAG: CBS domain-containing protein [Candidatus Bathyarchaeota archaeon]